MEAARKPETEEDLDFANDSLYLDEGFDVSSEEVAKALSKMRPFIEAAAEYEERIKALTLTFDHLKQ